MKLALTFPGQGSQQVGMGKSLADDFAEAAAVLEEVDDALGEKLSALIFEGPEETLTLTANAQPALMAVSMAVMRVLESRGFSVKDHASYVAGHSLGEYSALCAAGAFSVGETAKLLRIRGNAMQAAVPVGEGAMAAIIGLQQNVVEAICKTASSQGVCQIANDNGGGQFVISGGKTAVEMAAGEASEKGAKRALMLPVSAPFHSAMMAPAADEMKKALADASINQPAAPVVVNVLARPISNPEEIRERLVEQVTGRVRWAETVAWLASDGVDTLAEIGAGKVLSGLAKRIDRSLATQAIGGPAEIDAFMDKLETA